MASDWVVHKFGGSSVADAQCFRRVAEILEGHAPVRLGVVLSACRGVTDKLLELLTVAESPQVDWASHIVDLRQRHVAIAKTLLKDGTAAVYVGKLMDI
jgi:aspartokinase/homoserine dehydrogenase 1